MEWIKYDRNSYDFQDPSDRNLLLCDFTRNQSGMELEDSSFAFKNNLETIFFRNVDLEINSEEMDDDFFLKIKSSTSSDVASGSTKNMNLVSHDVVNQSLFSKKEYLLNQNLPETISELKGRINLINSLILKIKKMNNLSRILIIVMQSDFFLIIKLFIKKIKSFT